MGKGLRQGYGQGHPRPPQADVSLDEIDEIASEAGVTSMPTFHVYR